MSRKSDFHEDFGREDEVKVGSDRSFGLTVGGILALIGVVRWVFGDGLGWLTAVFLCVGAVLVLAGLIAPRILAPFKRAWMKLALLLYKVTNPIVMGLLFYFSVTPVALLMKLFGKDPLRLKFDAAASSYWIAREPPGPEPESMKQQF